MAAPVKVFEVGGAVVDVLLLVPVAGGVIVAPSDPLADGPGVAPGPPLGCAPAWPEAEASVPGSVPSPPSPVGVSPSGPPASPDQPSRLAVGAALSPTRIATDRSEPAKARTVRRTCASAA